MKKLRSCLFLFLLIPLFGGCQKSFNSPLLITEINVGSVITDRAVEITNLSEKEVNLKDFSLRTYRLSEKMPSEIIQLEGTIESHKSFVVVYTAANEQIKEKADLITDLLTCEGSYPMSLCYKNQIVDTLGDLQFVYNYARNGHLVRKSDFLIPEKKFNQFHWVRYLKDDISTLGNYDSLSSEELLNGPRLSRSDFDKPFCQDSQKGGGGLLETEVVYTIDGDTTNFTYGNSLSSYDIRGNLNTRYYGVNTPEISHGDKEADPYGNEARDFTNAILARSKKVLLQSISSYNLKETYGRMLCYVWVSEETNPNIEDYKLLNYLIIKNGFSHVGFTDRNADYISEMSYEGISFVEYLYDADLYAQENHLNINS